MGVREYRTRYALQHISGPLILRPRIRGVSLLLEVTGERKGLSSELVRVLQATGEQVRFAEIRHPEWAVIHHVHGGVLLHTLLQQRQCLSEAPGEHVGIAQRRRNHGEHERDVAGLTDTQTLFKDGDGRLEVPFAEVDQANTEIRMAARKGLIDRLSDLDGFFPTGQPLAKDAQFGQTPVQIGPTEHEGQAPARRSARGAMGLGGPRRCTCGTAPPADTGPARGT
jgi:hypothetical protein